MRVLLTGATGLVGKYVVEQVPHGVDLVRASRRSEAPSYFSPGQSIAIDLEDLEATRKLVLDLQPNVVIHAAAEGKVDAVEGHIKDYRRLNVDAARVLADVCFQRNVRFVHVSSNAVFGESHERFSEGSERRPVNDYGRLKVESEDAVMEANPSSLIVRPILMYGWPIAGHRTNPVVAWVRALREKRRITVVDDVWTEPLAAIDCARTIWAGAQSMANGPINVSGGHCLTLYSFACLVARVFELDASYIDAVPSVSFPEIAQRPSRTSFDLTKLKDLFGLEPMSPLEGLRWLRETEPSLGEA